MYKYRVLVLILLDTHLDNLTCIYGVHTTSRALGVHTDVLHPFILAHRYLSTL